MKHSDKGFSLVELVTSAAVLSVVMILLVQATGAVSRTWKAGVARIDNLTQARAVLSMIDRDLQSALLRPDLAAFRNENGIPGCSFYTMVRGGQGERQLSAISYSIPTGQLGLLRKDYGLNYDTKVLALGELTKIPDLGSPEAIAEELAAGAVCFQCQFVTTSGQLQTSFQFDFTNTTADTNTRTMVLSLLVLDNAAYEVSKATGIQEDLPARFAGNPAPGQTYADFWKERIDAKDLPEPVRAGLRLFERSFPIPCP